MDSQRVYFEYSADAVENYFKRVKMTIGLQTDDYAYVPPIMHSVSLIIWNL